MKLNKHDLHWCVRRLPYAVREILKKNELIIGGGYIRACITGEKISDIDIFCHSKEYAEDVVLSMVDEDEKRLRKTANAITVNGFKIPPQFITRWVFESPGEIILSFDFTICQAALWWDHYCQKWCSVVSDCFYQDLAAKRLIYTHPKRHEDAGGSLLRVLKYYQRGYRISLDSYAGVISRLVANVDINRVGFHGDNDKDGRFLSEDDFKVVAKGLLIEVDPAIDPDHILDD